MDNKLFVNEFRRTALMLPLVLAMTVQTSWADNVTYINADGYYSDSCAGSPVLMAPDSNTIQLTDTSLKETSVQQPVIADLVNNDLADYIGQLVTIQNVRIESGNERIWRANVNYGIDFMVEGFSNLYDYAYVDLTGIVSRGEGTDILLTAVDRSDLDPVVFVIDEDEEFKSPDCELPNCVVRLKRTLSKDYWNTFCVPFYIDVADMDIYHFEDVDGNTMRFVYVPDIEAGKPYLVKPWEDIVNPVFRGISLTATPQQNVEVPDFSFNGTYGLSDIDTDDGSRLAMFLKSDGKLYTPSQGNNRIKGMRAYFVAPKGVEARVAIEGTGQAVIDGVYHQSADSPCYDLQGRRVAQPDRGLYIVNGKKLLVR